MPRVASESGTIALATPGDRVEFVPPPAEDPTRSGLEKLAEAQWPKTVTAESTKLVYRFTKPEYKLTVEVKSTKPPVVAKGPDKKGPDEATKDPGPVIPKKEKEPEPVVKKGIDVAAAEEGVPLVLSGILRIEAPEPRRQAVLRHKDTKEYYRKFEGDTVDGLQITQITDNSVSLYDPKKRKTFTLSGRFEAEYETLGGTEKKLEKAPGRAPGKAPGKRG
jgi:hypothetical protein